MNGTGFARSDARSSAGVTALARAVTGRGAAGAAGQACRAGSGAGSIFAPVLALVLGSALVAIVCVAVVASNVLDARRAALLLAAAPSALRDAEPEAAPARRYPEPEMTDAAVSTGRDAAPRLRLAPARPPEAPLAETRFAAALPGRAPEAGETGAPGPGSAPVRLVAGRPALVPPPRPGAAVADAPVAGPGADTGADVAAAPTLVAAASGMSPARALTLPRPALRPARPGAEPGPLPGSLWPGGNPAGIAAAGPRAAPDAPPDAPPGAELVARAEDGRGPDSSLRPRLRPAALVAALPAPDAAPAAILPAALEIEVARAEPAAALGGLGESPRGGLFGGGGGTGTCSARLAREIPRRPGGAAGGAAVMAAVGNGSGGDRDNRLVQEALAGNVPDFLRDLRPVTLSGTVNGRRVDVTICVTPDYLAIGSDGDHVRVPLGLPAALRVADAFDMMLPTTTMVDAIYQQAEVRIAPSPMTPGASMSSTSYFVQHDATLDGQFARAGARPGMLVAGHKKDLVMTNRLSRNPGRVAIYGWHRTNGAAIQPLSTVHGEYYADYSHGIRLVSRTAFVNGAPVDLRDLLTDERYAGFLNDDGALTGATIRLAAL